MSRKRNKQQHQQRNTQAESQPVRTLDVLRGSSELLFRAHDHLASIFEALKQINPETAEPADIQSAKVELMKKCHSIMEVGVMVNDLTINEIDRVERETFLRAGLAAIA